MRWIDHPACQDGPVSLTRWIKWHVSQWLDRHARRLERDALYPNCEGCGTPRNRGDHSKCDELPF